MPLFIAVLEEILFANGGDLEIATDFLLLDRLSGSSISCRSSTETARLKYSSAFPSLSEISGKKQEQTSVPLVSDWSTTQEMVLPNHLSPLRSSTSFPRLSDKPPAHTVAPIARIYGRAKLVKNQQGKIVPQLEAFQCDIFTNDLKVDKRYRVGAAPETKPTGFGRVLDLLRKLKP